MTKHLKLNQTQKVKYKCLFQLILSSDISQYFDSFCCFHKDHLTLSKAETHRLNQNFIALFHSRSRHLNILL